MGLTRLGALLIDTEQMDGLQCKGNWEEISSAIFGSHPTQRIGIFKGQDWINDKYCQIRQ